MPSRPPPTTPGAAAGLLKVGEALRARRTELKLSATAAAEAAGMSRVTLHRVEKGEPNVAAAAYAAAASVVGLAIAVVDPREGVQTPSTRGWLPARISLARYPQLRELAWQVHGTGELAPREALDIYERTWRHLDEATLSDDERNLIDALRAALGA
jgi:transcriptional regulator with XRE-family HTH domain